MPAEWRMDGHIDVAKVIGANLQLLLRSSHKGGTNLYSGVKLWPWQHTWMYSRQILKCDGTRAETRFRLSAKRTNPFKSAGASIQSTTGSRDVRISGSNAGYTMFRGSVKGTGYPLHSPVSSSLPLLCVTVCHHFSAGLYLISGWSWRETMCILSRT